MMVIILGTKERLSLSFIVTIWWSYLELSDTFSYILWNLRIQK